MNVAHIQNRRLATAGKLLDEAPRLIAFYLPQYHPIPENDEWWGKGFTEWTNVSKAKPLFAGHYQPHLPADLGFYDLRLPDVRAAQAEMAGQYGIHGFCYYHYWFNGRRVLERPFNEVLASGEPDFPFCLCWANENWTRRWDGLDEEVLLRQQYSAEDDVAHIRSLLPAFEDRRYIRIGNKPLFAVYRSDLIPDPLRTTEKWRKEIQRAGLGEIFLAQVESLGGINSPASTGFDAAIEFAPDWRSIGHPRFQRKRFGPLRRVGLVPKLYREHRIYDYSYMADQMMAKPEPAYKRFLGVAPSWDNSARRTRGATIFRNATPQLYERWLRQVGEKTILRFRGDESLIFVNAWNEWGEGCHLEPDHRYGHAYLQATQRVLRGLEESLRKSC